MHGEIPVLDTLSSCSCDILQLDCSLCVLCLGDSELVSDIGCTREVGCNVVGCTVSPDDDDDPVVVGWETVLLIELQHVAGIVATLLLLC